MVEAEFPDGTTRQVPSRTKVFKSNEIDGTGSSPSDEEPIEDAEWRYIAGIGGKWHARPQR